MRIAVKFFASCREQVGTSSIDIDIPDDSGNTSKLIDVLVERFPALHEGIEEVSLAVNKKYIRGQIDLRNGDEVALIPPISGG
mmetsp:Transcript_27483/g.27704  ORF Transcript_27483/g.27704 Transcript_27483/m.27704 type:complete len:83 (-) Transcript_27483:321-569(-)